jgi:hypothetical protein
MGSHPYCYFTLYEADIAAALAALREQEFAAGRYDPALATADPPAYAFQQQFPPGEEFPAPGAQHGSIEEVMETMEESGTGSILDLMGIAPEPAFLHATALNEAEQHALFGTMQPTRTDVASLVPERTPTSLMDQNRARRLNSFWESIGRGEGRYVVVYEGDTPAEIFFAGMSID